MIELLIILIPFLIVDAFNPVLLAGMIYSLGTQRPFLHSSSVLFSYFTTYFLAGLFLALSLERLENYFRLAPRFDYILELGVAALLFYFAWSLYSKGDPHQEDQLTHEKKMSLAGALFLGLQVNLVGLPFAVPYLGAIDQVLKAELTPFSALGVIFLYNVLYIIPFACLLAVRFVYAQESQGIFWRINRWMHRVLVRYMPWVFAALGLLLVEDAVSFLLGYREYSIFGL